jgi:hypothetical protein
MKFRKVGVRGCSKEFFDASPLFCSAKAPLLNVSKRGATAELNGQAPRRKRKGLF